MRSICTSKAFADKLPDCSSLTVLVIAEPVRAANVAEWEARKRDIRLKRSSFKHLEDSPSLRVRITLSCRMSATHSPVCVCADRMEKTSETESRHKHAESKKEDVLLTDKWKTSMKTEWPFCVFSFRLAGDQTQYRYVPSEQRCSVVMLLPTGKWWAGMGTIWHTWKMTQFTLTLALATHSWLDATVHN